MLDLHPSFLLLVGEDGADLEACGERIVVAVLFVLVLVVIVVVPVLVVLLLLLLVLVVTAGMSFQLVVLVIGGAKPETYRGDAGRFRTPLTFGDDLVLLEIDSRQEAFRRLLARNAIKTLERVKDTPMKPSDQTWEIPAEPPLLLTKLFSSSPSGVS
ncbi:hypothetical protein AUC71_07940 [Methyloceanibacter marginalis]|uniref:Uncharacterized protein n=1 Tax=Methyloceanibacter marginalis TaxID=1774971 RepID=A0A1E3WE09_9HYPH|nr:hypothetical protein AUC71_07940 [Methyloceanibacter marginalis]